VREPVIDLHTHILPGVDDGSPTLDDALDMARSAVADGIRAVAATPHVRDDYPTEPGRMEEGVTELRAALSGAGIALDVLSGGEVAIDQLALLSEEDLARFGLGGNPDYVLLETPYAGWPLALPEQVRALTARGVIPVLAHPERNPDVQHDPERLRPLVLMGVLCQVTAASLDGRIGKQARRTGMVLVETGLAHIVASDAHTPDVRGIGMAAAAASVGDEALARWLTHGVPAAIVGGTELPPRPEVAPRRRLFRRVR
jgi:protein-tyrosine phosphatase